MSILIFCGPSGSGKSTLMKKLMEEFGKEKLGFSVSHTSRSPRPGEQDCVDYHFSSKEEMLDMKENGKFVETAEFAGNMYGTSKEAVQKVSGQGRICLLDIDVQGVSSVKGDPVLGPASSVVFVRPVSVQALEDRLRARGTEAEEDIQKRLSNAARELEFASDSGLVDLTIVNDDLEEAYQQLKEYIVEKFIKQE